MKEPTRRAYYSGIELVEAEDSNRPLHRRRAHQRHRFAPVQEHDRRREVGRSHRNRAPAGTQRRARGGCLPAIHAIATKSHDIPPFYGKLIRKIKAPIMIDTTDPQAVELALTYCQGKSIINSINLEDGEEKFERICPLGQSAMAPPWSWAPSMKTSCRRRPSRASANWPWPSDPTAAHAKSTASRRKTSSSIRWYFPAPPATPTISAARSRPSKASAWSKRTFPSSRPCSAFPMSRSDCRRRRAKW